MLRKNTSLTENNWVIHVGLIKTATSTVQRGVFLQHSQIDYYGKPYVKNPNVPDGFQAVIEKVACKDEVNYKKSEILDYFESHVFRNHSSEKKKVFSEELLSATETTDQRVVANRLQDIFGESKILISIRNQRDLLISHYLHNIVRLTGYIPFEKYLIENWRGAFDHSNIRNRLKFYELAKVYSDVFGIENIVILPMEMLRDNFSNYSQTLSDIIGIDGQETERLLKGRHGNQRLSEREFLYCKFAKSFPFLDFRSKLNGNTAHLFEKLIRGGNRTRVLLPPEWAAEIDSYYAADNRMLMDFFGVDLHKYGYPVREEER